jgi:hypothetical protein
MILRKTAVIFPKSITWLIVVLWSQSVFYEIGTEVTIFTLISCFKGLMECTNQTHTHTLFRFLPVYLICENHFASGIIKRPTTSTENVSLSCKSSMYCVLANILFAALDTKYFSDNFPPINS